MKHAPSAGSIAWTVDQQSSALPLYYGRPLSGKDVITQDKMDLRNWVYYAIDYEVYYINCVNYLAVIVVARWAADLLIEQLNLLWGMRH